MSIIGERLRVGQLWQRLLTDREQPSKNQSMYMIVPDAVTVQGSDRFNWKRLLECNVFLRRWLLFWQRLCTATCSNTRWSTSSSPSAGWTTSWWGSYHYAAQSDCGTPTRYTHTHAYIYILRFVVSELILTMVLGAIFRSIIRSWIRTSVRPWLINVTL